MINYKAIHKQEKEVTEQLLESIKRGLSKFTVQSSYFDKDDIVQDVFISLWQDEKAMARIGTNFDSAITKGIIKNRIIDILRSRLGRSYSIGSIRNPICIEPDDIALIPQFEEEQKEISQNLSYYIAPLGLTKSQRDDLYFYFIKCASELGYNPRSFRDLAEIATNINPSDTRNHEARIYDLIRIIKKKSKKKELLSR